MFCTFHIWKCTHYPNIVNNNQVDTTPTLSTIVYIMFLFLFLFFPKFLAIFALLTIFGNVHRPCKHYSKIVNNSVH
ncbi:hypothetical protein K443DRAFT_91525 [Laccaria amethystina LaAM-08-1]|uniref:Uncharacterized protein n=1 Tax=Laccaria amethystina LaAM-08-1 TaxID=1095629 RepID=A0A0C9Y516_9AGAR|nr:hypothetical protein K443DRAFT_91525 [Laccaria amethystina LaAM-08-1]